MKKLRFALFSFSEHIPAARWCLALAVIAFTAVTGVHKYIDMAEMTAFSSLEVLYLLLTDITNIVFIYLPLYLFIICGIMFDSGYGELEILRCESRNEWLFGKLFVYTANTLLFFGAMLFINLFVCSRVFNFSGAWSGGFIGFNVMLGQRAEDFSSPPLLTIVTACLALLLFYGLCGVVNMLISLLSAKEAAALFASLILGIALGLANMLLIPDSAGFQLIRCAVLCLLYAGVYGLCRAAVKRKDFAGNKMY